MLPFSLLLLLALSACRCAKSAPPCVVPVQMEGSEEATDVPVARIKVGHADETLRLVLDFYAVGVTVSSHVPWMRSTTYMTAAGIDVVDLCHRRIRLPVRYDPEAAAAAGCPTCHGTFGLGRFNPLWMAWKRVTLSGGAMILDEERGGGPLATRPSVKCAIGHPGFCLARARIGNHSYRLDFSFRTQETYLPPAIYDEYVGCHNLDKDRPSAWKNLRMWVGDTEIVIRRHHIIPMSQRLGIRRLLVKPGGGDTIVLGKSTLRALRFLRDTEDETITVMSWNCNRSNSAWGWVILILAGIFQLRWKGTHDGLWLRKNDRIYPDRLLIEVFAAFLAFWAYFLPSVREGLEDFRIFSVYSIVVISTLTAWMVFTLAVYYADRTEWIGDVFLLPQKRRPPPKVGLPRRPAFASHGAPLSHDRALPPEGTALVRLSPRVAIMRTVAVETLLLMASILVLNETREDTLASLFPFLFTLGYLFILYYWGWLALYYTPNIKPMGVWMLWWFYYLSVVGVSSWVTAVEIVIPFFERFVPELVWRTEVSAVMIYVFVAYLATRMGIAAVNAERTRLYFLGVRYVGPFRIVRPAPGSTSTAARAVVAYPRPRRSSSSNNYYHHHHHQDRTLYRP